MELIAVVTYGILAVILGTLISLFYEKSGQTFLSILDLRELPTAILGYLIVAPLVWTFYIWQPQGMIQVFEELHLNGVIGASTRNTTLDNFIKQELAIPCNRRRNLLIASVATLLGILVGVLSTILPSSQLNLGVFQLRYWWTVNPLYFYGIYFPLVFVLLYMVV